eukprot:748494-Hanusia_phi.AAC.2
MKRILSVLVLTLVDSIDDLVNVENRREENSRQLQQEMEQLKKILASTQDKLAREEQDRRRVQQQLEQALGRTENQQLAIRELEASLAAIKDAQLVSSSPADEQQSRIEQQQLRIAQLERQLHVLEQAGPQQEKEGVNLASQLRSQLEDISREKVHMLERISVLEEQLRLQEAGSDREASRKIEELQEKLQASERAAHKNHIKYRRQQQQGESLQKELGRWKEEAEELKNRLRSMEEIEESSEAAGRLGGTGDELAQLAEENRFKREALLEQEKELVSVMHEARMVERNAASAKDGQESILLEAVLEASRELQAAKEMMEKGKEIEEQLQFQQSVVTDLTLEHRRLNDLIVGAREAAVKVR